ncbi:MAG TPA: hypothetical protein VEA36_01240 [Candidatus Paceibacterota bacterium]|nr:hypothetical protein [Candidatus Paceibacterota bacterium]
MPAPLIGVAIGTAGRAAAGGAARVAGRRALGRGVAAARRLPRRRYNDDRQGEGTEPGRRNIKRIDAVNIFFLVIVAVVIDVLQFFLTLTLVGSLVAFILSIAAWVLFFLWFLSLGVNYFNKGNAMKFLVGLGSVCAELVPFLNAITPALTAGVVAVIILHNLEAAEEERLRAAA